LNFHFQRGCGKSCTLENGIPTGALAVIALKDGPMRFCQQHEKTSALTIMLLFCKNIILKHQE
jgi:hypothetical protein